MSGLTGPWYASLDGHGAYSIEDCEGQQICFVGTSKEHKARLIAAAPELLAALECEEALDKPTAEAYQILRRHGWDDEERWELGATEFVRRMRRAAIAKATGAQS